LDKLRDSDRVLLIYAIRKVIDPETVHIEFSIQLVRLSAVPGECILDSCLDQRIIVVDRDIEARSICDIC
jgi:hypothetical protein